MRKVSCNIRKRAYVQSYVKGISSYRTLYSVLWLREINILFYSILFYSILFYSILLYFILFYSILFLSSSVCLVPILNDVYDNCFYCAQMWRVDDSCSLPFSSSFSVISAQPSIIRCPRKDDSLPLAVTNTAASLITALSALCLTLS
jgi:hypothetical protein